MPPDQPLEPTSSQPRQGIQRLAEPHVLFPALALIVTLLLWGGAYSLIEVERNNAHASARTLTRDLTETYEAQVVRVLRDIRKDFQVMQFSFELYGGDATLAVLEERDLLPPGFLFTVSILGPDGELLASTRPDPPAIDYRARLPGALDSDELQVAPSVLDPQTDEWELTFSQRLDTADGSFAGVAVITVDAAFLVAGYETAKMGEHGSMGLVGTDGTIRVRRTGNQVDVGNQVDYQRLVPDPNIADTNVRLAVSPIDGIERYFGARQLYDFPLAVFVTLSRAEQLAPTEARVNTYLWRTAAANVLLLLIVALLWWMSHKLAVSRRHELQARISHARQIEYLAYHDGLTGLPNRSLFSQLLGQSIAQAHRHQRQLAVLFLDLDHFKQINDTLGHDAGDQLLCEVAVRLQGCLRESDTVARLGGDEFIVVMPEITDVVYTTTVARKIISAVASPYLLAGEEFRVTASIGIATYPQDGLDEQTLTKNADTAMYKAKEEGKNNFQLYSDKLRSESLDRLNLESSLRHALELDQFKLYYQAKRDVHTGEVTGMEALLRWQHPDLGLVAPLRFMAIAEETGLIIPIGKWVLESVCNQSAHWRQEGLPRVRVAVNLSSRQFFDPDLPEAIAKILQKTGVEADTLELEINEAILMRDLALALAVLTALKAVGVRIAIDNFGVGYSSLALLRQLPLDAIKIDRSFMRDFSDTIGHKPLAEAIVAMGRTLGLTVVAQGVESEEQVVFLREHACNEVQGFYIKKPIPADQVAALLRQATEHGLDENASDRE
ncbi:MAG: EAL domain-containing protein [Haliea sp.]